MKNIIKKIISPRNVGIVVAVLFITSVTAHAQIPAYKTWLLRGTDLSAQGVNVGIGTIVPTQKLDVVGTVRMTGFEMPTGAADKYVLTSDASGAGTWQPSTSALHAEASGPTPISVPAQQDLTIMIPPASVSRYATIIASAGVYETSLYSSRVSMYINSPSGNITSSARAMTLVPDYQNPGIPMQGVLSTNTRIVVPPTAVPFPVMLFFEAVPVGVTFNTTVLLVRSMEIILTPF